MDVKEIQLFNTRTRTKELFRSQDPNFVRIYCCGPTVYHYAHIGNLRTYVSEDVMLRALHMAGYKFEHVMNITDVGHLVDDGDDGEDKMEKGSRREGKTAWQIAEEYTQAFFKDTERLNIIRPTVIPKATDHVQEMIALVQRLEEKGITYRTSDGIYYDTKKFPAYADFAKLDIENLEAGKRVEIGEKRNPTDFALWKFSPEEEQRQMEWDSPWGKGFPGWHIECSAMSEKYLGATLDIHWGGKDHIPVHHTNEIAQSEAANGCRFCNYWLHGAFLTEDRGKMSKSHGEFLTLQVLINKGYDPLDYRFFLLQAHYRTELKFSYEVLDSAKQGRLGLEQRFKEWQDLNASFESDAEYERLQSEFEAAILDDLNTAKGLSTLFEVVKSATLPDAAKKSLVLNFDEILGLKLAESIEQAQAGEDIPDDIAAIVLARDGARKNKNWAESDRLRDALQAADYLVADTSEGTTIKRSGKLRRDPVDE